MLIAMEWTNNHQPLMLGIVLFLMIFGLPMVNKLLEMWL